MSSEGSKGRGNLMRKLLEAPLTSSSSSSSNEAASTRQDSGFQEIATIASGRGRALLLRVSSEDTSNSGTTPSKGKGRGAVLFNLGEQYKVADKTEELAKNIENLQIKETIEQEPVIKKGIKGQPTDCVVNYIRLETDPNMGVYEYNVKFTPDMDSKNLRVKYLNEHKDKFGGTKTFDGNLLFLPKLLPEKVTVYHSKNIADNSDIKIEVIFKRKRPIKERIHLYNILFDRIMKTLNYVKFGRKQYDPTDPKIIPQQKLEIWPGYITAVDEYEGGIMLCCDVSHKVLCQLTVAETLREIYHGSKDMFQEKAKKALIGSIVLTRYNNKTYRIDDIDFNSNPTATFKTENKDISFAEYYKSHHNITINDLKQPILISMKQERVSGKNEPQEYALCLIPEICYLTGLRDDLRTDYKVMRDLATFTRVTPNQRIAALEKFYSNVDNSKDAKQILASWGLKLCSRPEKLVGRQLDEEKIIFARRQISVGQNADFNREATSNELLEVIAIRDWLLIHTINDTKYARNFVECIEKNSRPMGMQVCKPITKALENDRTETYAKALRDSITNSTQIVVIICPTQRDDRYAAIKKICCSEIPIPSQVINSRTLSNESKNRAIVQKIALQMNCKLGGTLWSIKIPFQKVMICGIDAYHDPSKKSNSVSAFVASLNGAYTRWYSRAGIQNTKEELVGNLCLSLKLALDAYRTMNNFYPEKIIIFRDGIGDGQFQHSLEYEIPQLQQACKIEDSEYNPLFTFIVVQKRINTRVFVTNQSNEYQNPHPGFILDHTVTRRYLYDFFLVSQSVRQGTVSPCHYVVLYDSANFSPDILQRLSYKLCFLYYNWPGTVTVPACCQYAHKMAYLVGQHIRRQTSEKLATQLFYL